MNYCELEKFLSRKLKHAKVISAGASVLGRTIYAVEFDFNSKYTVIIQGSIHAREHITTDLICRFIKDMDKWFSAFYAKHTPNVIFVPMVNPDGVQLCYFGIKSVKNQQIKNELLHMNNQNKDFSQFKANINGVDLNNNFDAKWGGGVENILNPAPSGYIGKSPMSEPEVQALARLTEARNVIFTISYHAKGEEVYFQFYNLPCNYQRDKNIATLIADSLNYKLVNTQATSCGGYKDWCVLRKHIPAITIEVGSDKIKHPIGKKFLKSIYEQNRCVLDLLSKVQKEYIDANTRRLYESCD